MLTTLFSYVLICLKEFVFPSRKSSLYLAKNFISQILGYKIYGMVETFFSRQKRCNLFVTENAPSAIIEEGILKFPCSRPMDGDIRWNGLITKSANRVSLMLELRKGNSTFVF